MSVAHNILAIHVNLEFKKSVFSGQFLPSDSDDKSKFGLCWNIKVPHFTSDAAQADFTPVHLPVLLVVLLSPLEDQFPFRFAGLKAETFQCILTCKIKNKSIKSGLLYVPFSRPASS